MCRHQIIAVLALTLALGAATPRTSQAAWPYDGKALCAETHDQINPAIAPDGGGGAIITWEDTRNGSTNHDVFAQRVNADGILQWTANNSSGVAVCTATANQLNPTIVSDGAGGAIITWRDDRRGPESNDIYAQRVSASGEVQWTTNGVALCTAPTGFYRFPKIVSDNVGGAIVVWADSRGIYARGVNAMGSPLWATDGEVLSQRLSETPVEVAPDGSGGALVTWTSAHNSTDGDQWDVYAQRVNPMGSLLWATDGVALIFDIYKQDYPSVVSDGGGGAIIAWADNRQYYVSNGNLYDIFSGVVGAGGGVLCCTQLTDTGGQQNDPKLASDGQRGAIVTWSDGRSGGEIYAQRADNGWPTANGVAVCIETGQQTSSTIVPDDAGGAILAWQDGRSLNGSDIYAQRVNSLGVAQWTYNGVALCTASNVQVAPQIVTDGAHGAIVAWQDNRSGNYDIYAKRVSGPLQPPGAPTIGVNWGYSSFQVWWTGRGDVVDEGTPQRWVVYMDGDSIVGGIAHGPGVQELVEKDWVTPCTYHDIYVRVVGRDGYRMSQSNTVSGQICCSTQCDTERSHAADGGDLSGRSYPLALGQPRPNPTKGGAAEITWSFPVELAGQRFQIAVFDVSGRKIATVAEGQAEAGSFAKLLQAPGEAPLTSGAYFLRLQIGSSRLTRSLILGR